MKKLSIAVLFVAIWVLSAGEFGLAQAPKPSLSVPSTDVYGGFLATSPDYGPSFSSFLMKGFEGAFSKAITDRIWITATGNYVSTSSFDVKQVSGTVGPKIYLMTGKFRPYATVQAGFAYQRSHGFYAADHHPPLAPGAVDIEKGLTYRFGGGVEYQFMGKFYWRGQWDLQPQPWGRHTPFYQNLGTGIGYRF